MNILLTKSVLTTTRRAAFDIGSGATKLIVSDVGFGAETIILNICFGQERPCAYGADWLRSKDGNLTTAIQTKGREIFSDLKKIAENLDAKSYSAIATEVFRKASNGQDYINNLSTDMGVPIRIVTQEEEAQLGYATGIALRQSHDSTNKKCLVWDSGGASFQITYREHEIINSPLQHYVGSFGSGVSMKILVEGVQNRLLKDIETPNPLSTEDAYALIRKLLELLPPDVPDWLRDAASVTAIGGPNSVFYLASTVISSLTTEQVVIHGDPVVTISTTESSSSPSSSIVSTPVMSYTVTEVQNAFNHCLNQTDGQLQRFMAHSHADPPSLVVPKLALLVAVMLHTGIRRVDFVEAIGSCAGVLISEAYWE